MQELTENLVVDCAWDENGYKSGADCSEKRNTSWLQKRMVDPTAGGTISAGRELLGQIAHSYC